MDALLRGELFATLAVFGHDETLKDARKRFQAFLEDRNTHLLPPDIRRVDTLLTLAVYSYLELVIYIYICTTVIFTLSLFSLAFGQAVYVAVMKNVTSSDRSGFDSLLRVYRETDLSQEKTRILGHNGGVIKLLQNL